MKLSKEWILAALGIIAMLFILALIGVGSAFLLVLNGYGA